MFSAGNDLSIVTWHPPGDADAAPTPPARAPPSPLQQQEGRRQRHDSASTEEPSPPPARPPSPAQAAQEPTAAEDGSGEVAQTNDPGVVVHVAEIVGMVVMPGGVVSADLAGRLLERGPDRLIGKCL